MLLFNINIIITFSGIRPPLGDQPTKQTTQRHRQRPRGLEKVLENELNEVGLELPSANLTTPPSHSLTAKVPTRVLFNGFFFLRGEEGQGRARGMCVVGDRRRGPRDE
ncbi:hypothetical protein BDFG_01649 [Blastomyces dermatitidis ATCC 26199]|nr:hypothetical protein BDFG_01649 [Blastomyces dermatitidis ATCC 26199]